LPGGRLALDAFKYYHENNKMTPLRRLKLEGNP
jgi:hypothetical protein